MVRACHLLANFWLTCFAADKLDMSQVFDPHVAAGALKLYFREQIEALIPVNTCQEYSDAASMIVNVHVNYSQLTT